ncbi:MAG TPA: type II toxin-antitoxin system HicB family antitoxin [Alphaproteobacteria bacterium]|nr:type II toxin-antitoxin system HicB family antitoxin [Alphaproteobacteria bacterium]
MSKSLSHKGYAAQIGFDAEDRIFFGRITGIADIVTFHGETVDDLISAFETAVDEYIAMSAKLGRKAQKPYSGKLMLRVPPELHARAAMLAEASGKSINAWVTELLSQAS